MNKPEFQTTVLKYDSRANELHRPIIKQLIERSYSCKCITREVQNQIFGEDGIVCIVPSDRNAESVSKRFFGFAVNVVREEEMHKYGEIPDLVLQRRDLLQDVLAAHFSINETLTNETLTASDIPFEGYRQQIQELEDFCWNNDIPSLLPNLFLPKSVGRALEGEQYNPEAKNMMGMYERLTGLYLHHSRHLQAVLYQLSSREKFTEVISLVDDVAAMRGESIEQLLPENSVLASTYILSLYALERDEDVLRLGWSLRNFFGDEEHMADRYIASIKRTRNADALSHLLNNIQLLPLRHSMVQDRFRDTCIEIGWDLYGFGKYEELKILLEHIAYMRKSHSGVAALFDSFESLVQE
jgi:hypothetical protein